MELLVPSQQALIMSTQRGTIRQCGMQQCHPFAVSYFAMIVSARAYGVAVSPLDKLMVQDRTRQAQVRCNSAHMKSMEDSELVVATAVVIQQQKVCAETCAETKANRRWSKQQRLWVTEAQGLQSEPLTAILFIRKVEQAAKQQLFRP
eukprot:scaffold117165_cov26-Tisochrysis_lutea.AAC.2